MSTLRRAIALTVVAGAAAAAVSAATAPSRDDRVVQLADRVALAIGGRIQLAMVRATPQQATLLAQGFDLTEHGRDGELGVVLYPGDQARLAATGLDYRVVADDMVADDIRDRLAEQDWVAQDASPVRPLPGESPTGYRTLAEHEAALRQLAADNPDFVRVLELPNATHEGRTVVALQIAADPDAAFTDGRPMSILTGLHHAREWPSAELTTMFAHDVVAQYNAGNLDITTIIDNVNFIVIPVVNPDGYVRSRETVSDFLVPVPSAAVLAASEFAYHRKNLADTGGNGITGQGVDPNRNYPYKWGGPGASPDPSSATYHGPTPGSEPEVRNVLGLLRANQVTTFITNHTFGDMVLRPFGDSDRDTPDEAIIKGHADAMAAINGYASIKGIELYATTGTTEDWIYGVTGAPGFTFEIGSNDVSGGQLAAGGVDCSGFHPMYFLCVPEQYQLNRGAYLLNLRQALNTQWHSRLVGTAEPGTVLILRKDVEFPLSVAFDGDEWMRDYVETTLVVGVDGAFDWHVNPSPTPQTVMDIADGFGTDDDLETWTLTATGPDGSVTVVEDLLVRRGEIHEFAF